jgi:hypothetical protein
VEMIGDGALIIDLSKGTRFSFDLVLDFFMAALVLLATLYLLREIIVKLDLGVRWAIVTVRQIHKHMQMWARWCDPRYGPQLLQRKMPVCATLTLAFFLIVILISSVSIVKVYHYPMWYLHCISTW